MMFCMAVYFNFLIGGVSGVFLSDTPVDVTVHGGFFVLSHFHYTIMGGLIFAFFAGLYFWLPKMTGKQMNKKLGVYHFWTMFVFFNLTFSRCSSLDCWASRAASLRTRRISKR